MKTKKVLFIILTTFSIRVIISCCDCLQPEEYFYSFDYFSVYNLDNSGKLPIISETNTVPKEAYGIQIDFSLIRISLNHTKTFMMFPEGKAFDCFCKDTLFTARDTISSIEVLTIKDFDLQHPANSDVSELFKVLTYSMYLTLQEYLDQPEKVYYSYMPAKEPLSLFLLRTPDNIGEQQFKIEIMFSDQRMLSLTTNPVILQ
jgi:hypothetical protein